MHHNDVNFQISLLMHRVGNSMPPTVPAPVVRAEENMQIGMGGQETPSESSEADSSECDTTGDEDGWESGESASLVVKRHSHIHGSSQSTHSNAHQKASLGRASKESLPRGERDERGSQKSNSTVSIRRSSGFFQSSALDT